jgi:hypothetical protein
MTPTPTDAPARHELLAALADVFGRRPSATRTAGYVEATADIPLEALRAGVQHAMRAHRFLPSPAELRAAVSTAGLNARLLDTVVEDTDPRVLTHCGHCGDSGWRFRDEWRAEGLANVVSRCPCHVTNPRLVAQRSGVGASAGGRP